MLGVFLGFFYIYKVICTEEVFSVFKQPSDKFSNAHTHTLSLLS